MVKKQYLVLREKFSLGKEKFIEKARFIHGSKYDYSKVVYINARTKVCIICPMHGEFWQTPDKHLQGQGCSICSNRYKRTTEEFINNCEQVHGKSFDYSKSIYQGNKKELIVKCNKCGKEFKITPHNHLVHKEGCPFCKLSKLEKSVEKVLLDNGIEYEQQKVFEWLIDGKKD